MGKIISLEEKIIKDCFLSTSKILINAKKDYNLNVSVTLMQLEILIGECYQLYKKKKVIYQYLEDMNLCFNDCIANALEQYRPIEIDQEYLMEHILFCQFFASPIEISQQDVKKTIDRAKCKMKIKKGANNGK